MNEQQEASAPAGSPKRKIIVVAIILVVLAVGCFIYWMLNKDWAETDDAQVQGHLVPISPRVNGYVSRILVDDNQGVAAGQVLVELDPKDLTAKLQKNEADLAQETADENAASTRISLVQRTSQAGEQEAGDSVSVAEAAVQVAGTQIASAEAQLAAARANADVADEAVSSARHDIDAAAQQVSAGSAAIQAGDADIVSLKAQARKAADDVSRYEQLYSRGATSQQDLEAMQTASDSADAAVTAARDRVGSTTASYRQSKARKSSAEVGLSQAESRAAAARESVKQAMAGLRMARNALIEAQARVAVARASESGAQTSPQQVSISQSQQKSATAKIQQSLADIRNSELQLSYTTIAAPESGVVSMKSVEPGESVAPGQLLMALVPLQDTWVVANFKETQTGRMHPGQRAEIAVDSYPGRTFYGRVDSIGAATGATFSLLPEENATGNFVKVVERIPVKIILDNDSSSGIVLRPGMNVIARIHLVD